MKRFDMSSILSVSVLIIILIVAGCAEIHRPTLDAEAYFNRGLAYLQKYQYDQAISDFTKAIEIDPRSASAYNNRGLAWKNKGDYDRAIADYNKAFEINLQNYIADSVIDDCNKLLEKNPQDAYAYRKRGLAWYNKGDYDRAIADYNKALEINPRDAEAYNRLAWLFAVCPKAEYRDGQKAVSLAKKAIGINSKDYILDTLAAAYAEAGNFEMAVKTEQKAYSMKNSPEYKNMIEAYKKGWTYTEYQKRKNQ
jgi:tetratricopeptide (TPR) repeat protein